MVLASVSKDESPKCKHLTTQVCQLMTISKIPLSLQHIQLKLEANLAIPANGETGEKARVLGNMRERGYTTAGKRHQDSTVIKKSDREGQPIDVKEMPGSETIHVLTELTMCVTNCETQNPREEENKERACAKPENTRSVL